MRCWGLCLLNQLLRNQLRGLAMLTQCRGGAMAGLCLLRGPRKLRVRALDLRGAQLGLYS